MPASASWPPTARSSQPAPLTAAWITLPLAETLDGSLHHQSDASPAGNAAIETPLAPSFAEWETNHGVAGTTADPDLDQLDNLLEYALGGDPLSGVLLLDGFHPLTLRIGIDGANATASFPVRTDADLRGLSYIIEWSVDLPPGSWTATPPAGTTTGDEDWSPPAAGFQRRFVAWPAAPGPPFARLRVDLDEGP